MSFNASLTVCVVRDCDVHRQVATSNVVLLHPQSSERANAAAAKTKRWDKRKSKETKRGVKRERVTFFAAQYDLDEPLLKQFVMFMAAECADKTSTDFIEVSSRYCHAPLRLSLSDRTCTHSFVRACIQIANRLSKFLWFATSGKGLIA